MLNIKICLDIISCWQGYKYQISLQIIASHFPVQAVRLLKLQAIYTEYRKTLTFTNNAVANCIAAILLFTVHTSPRQSRSLLILLILISLET